MENAFYQPFCDLAVSPLQNPNRKLLERPLKMKKIVKFMTILVLATVLCTLLSGERMRWTFIRKLWTTTSSQNLYDIPPELDKSSVEYPTAIREAGVEGRVLVKIVVGVNGQCKSATIARSSGWAVLDSAAIESVMNYSFKPAMYKGQAVEATISLPLLFQRH